MKMKKLAILFVMFCLVFILPGLAEEKKDDKVDIKIKFGAKVDGKSDFQGKVNEYSKVEDGVRPILKAKISGKSKSTFFNLISDFRGDMDEMYHKLDADFNRYFRQKMTFDSIYHRLDHDRLANMDVVSETRSAAYSDDLNPNDNYFITRSEFTSNTQIMIPGLSSMKLYVDFRSEHRKGQYQARTLSKCSTCHVVAQTREISNTNRDIKIGTKFRIGKANIDYSFTNNQFREQKAAPMHDYLPIKHPENLKPVFTSRIAVGNNESLSIDTLPDSKKNTHLLQTAIPVAANTTLTAQYLNANVENEFNNLKWKTNSFAGGFSTLFGRKAVFNLRFHQIKITNDSIYIDVNEPADVGGPNVGQTYAERYGGVYDYTRLSALSRTVIDIDANFRYRFNKKIRLKLGYEYKKVDREHYDVQSTKSSTFKASIKFRPVKQLKLTIDGKFKSINDPFINLYAATSGVVQTASYSNPFVGSQFIDFHEARMNHLGNSPENLTEIKARLNWNPAARFSLNGNVIYRTEKNDAIDDFANGLAANWQRDFFQWGIDMWASLGNKTPLTISYYKNNNQYDSLFSIPVLEGCGGGIIQGMPGALTDMYGYDIDNQTLLVNLHYLASKKVALHLGFSYNDSLAEIVEWGMDETQLPFIPGTGPNVLEYDDFQSISDYSKLEMKQIMAELGINFKLNKNWAVNGSFYYYFYDDMTDFLFEDTTGKKYSFFAGFTWSN
jgi:Putative outer membrane beta-barrel porin, MtrB/PioB